MAVKPALARTLAWILTAALSAWLFRVPVAAAEAAPDPAKLAQVLVPVEARWNITGTPVITQENAQTMLGAATGSGLNLESTAPTAAPSEVIVQFLMRPAAGTSCALNVQMGCAARPAMPSMNAYLVTTAGQESLTYSVASPLTTLQFQAVSDRSLAWPEELRKTIEAQMAASPRLAQTMLTLRCTLERGRYCGYLNSRLLGSMALPEGIDPSGIVKIQAGQGVQLISVRVHTLAARANGISKDSDPRFEPVSIGGNLNASTIGHERIDHASLPPPEQATTIDGVQFRFPAPAANGDDHIDVGTSWTRYGALPGFFMAYGGAFGGRWTATDRIDPCRIAMYVPRGRYKALHLIAAADGQEDKTPVVTAQFYRPSAGHPINFAGRVPELGGKPTSHATEVPVKLARGKNTHLYHVVIPLDPGAFDWLSDQERIALEFTKAVEFYRAYPDPLEYSWHGAGLPSSVQIYAATLERAEVDVELEPTQICHIWTAPATPGYTIRLRNQTGTPATVKLDVSVASYDGKESTTQPERTVALPAGPAPVAVQMDLHPQRFGLHYLKVTVTADGDAIVHQRKIAYLAPDTRERGDWAEGKGGLFGFFGWGAGHDAPGTIADITAMGQAGAETSLGVYGTSKDPEVRALAAKYHIISEEAFDGGVFYTNAFVSPPEVVAKYNPKDPAGSAKAMIDEVRKYQIQPGPLNKPTYMAFFPEPLVAERLPSSIFPYHYNAPDYQFTKTDEAMFEHIHERFMISAPAVRKEWPNVKILFPYGDPMNTAIMLQRAPETRGLIDGVAIDIPGFERLPEQQINQVVLNRLYPILKDIKKYVKNPYMVMIEGPCVSAKAIDITNEEKADIEVRNLLLLLGYGILRHPSANSSFECGDYWGENHYGGGYLARKPLGTPEIGYVGYATLTRHLNRANFVQYVPTGSTSVFCQQFKHYKTGKLIHVLWTMRGTRPVSVKVNPGATLELYDQNDNVTVLKEKDGQVMFTIDHAPQYLEGLTADAAITLGESDHSDSRPATVSALLTNLGEKSWKLVEREDLDYAKNSALQLERFLGKMEARRVDAPQLQGSKALAIHLGPQEIDRTVMPYYTTLEPRHPITIEGKASHLGLWVHAASDWGRVVYVLRDAKGQKWISVGSKEEWNCDDVHAWSAFCFDGWRYLRFELPSSAPYDCYREYGTTWWGAHGGDGIVNLPLKLEKVIVERRPKVIYGAQLVSTKPDDVLLGDLYAEYASPADKTDEAVRLSRLRMPLPAGLPELTNPISDMAKTGLGTATTILKVADPPQEPDGTRCNVHFTPVAAAKSYDVWVSPYADGRGAMKLGAAWTEPGKLIEGLRPDMELYAFVIYTDKDGKASRPSAPFRFMLKDRFVYK